MNGVWEAVTPLADDVAQHEFWQPREFKIGDRVRVRLSGECQRPRIYSRAGTRQGSVIPGKGHYDAEEDVQGSIIRCPNVAAFSECPFHNDHPFVVRLDTTIFNGQADIRAIHYAACELELLEP